MKGLVAWWLRALFGLLSIILLVSAKADSLILIRPEVAGPNVPAALEAHSDWVLWPVPYPTNSENGLLSLLSGYDWQGSQSFLRFEPEGDVSWLPAGRNALESKGYLHLRDLFLAGKRTQLVTDSRGDTTESALLLAASSNPEAVRGQRIGWPVDPKSLVIYQAHSWDDARLVSRMSEGAALVVEFPPAPGTRWSRFWLFDRHWREGASVPRSKSVGWPGLIPARELVSCLLGPRSLDWGTANLPPLNWLTRFAVVSPVVRAVYLTAVFLALGYAVIVIKRELSSKVFRAVLLTLMAFPAMDLSTSEVCRIAGIDSWPVVLPTTGFLLLAIVTAADLLPKRSFGDPSLFAVSLVGSLVLSICSSTFSDYSGLFSGTPSFEAEGMLAAYLTGLLVSCSSIGWRIGMTAVAIAAAFLTGGNPVVPALAMAATLSWGWFSMLICALVPALSISRFSHLTWTPFGLLDSVRDLSGHDLSPYALALLSLPLFATAVVFCFLGLFSLGFAQHHLVKTFRKSALCNALGTLCLYMGSMILFEPGMVGSVLCVGLGCALVLVYVAVE